MTIQLNKDFIESLYIPRNIDSHKGSFGHSLIIAGSNGFSGSATITTNSAVRTGSGLVTVMTDPLIQNIISSQVLEAMTANFNETERFKNLLRKSNSIAFGPGLGNSETTLSLLEFVIDNSSSTIILDADGINVLSRKSDLLIKLKKRCIITPHIIEFSRVSSYSIEDKNNDKINIMSNFAKK